MRNCQVSNSSGVAIWLSSRSRRSSSTFCRDTGVSNTSIPSHVPRTASFQAVHTILRETEYPKKRGTYFPPPQGAPNADSYRGNGTLITLGTGLPSESSARSCEGGGAISADEGNNLNLEDCVVPQLSPRTVDPSSRSKGAQVWESNYHCSVGTCDATTRGSELGCHIPGYDTHGQGPPPSPAATVPSAVFRALGDVYLFTAAEKKQERGERGHLLMAAPETRVAVQHHPILPRRGGMRNVSIPDSILDHEAGPSRREAGEPHRTTPLLADLEEQGDRQGEQTSNLQTEENHGDGQGIPFCANDVCASPGASCRARLGHSPSHLPVPLQAAPHNPRSRKEEGFGPGREAKLDAMLVNATCSSPDGQFGTAVHLALVGSLLTGNRMPDAGPQLPGGRNGCGEGVAGRDMGFCHEELEALRGYAGMAVGAQKSKHREEVKFEFDIPRAVGVEVSPTGAATATRMAGRSPAGDRSALRHMENVRLTAPVVQGRDSVFERLSVEQLAPVPELVASCADAPWTSGPHQPGSGEEAEPMAGSPPAWLSRNPWSRLQRTPTLRPFCPDEQPTMGLREQSGAAGEVQGQVAPGGAFCGPELAPLQQEESGGLGRGEAAGFDDLHPLASGAEEPAGWASGRQSGPEDQLRMWQEGLLCTRDLAFGLVQCQKRKKRKARNGDERPQQQPPLPPLQQRPLAGGACLSREEGYERGGSSQSGSLGSHGAARAVRQQRMEQHLQIACSQLSVLQRWEEGTRELAARWVAWLLKMVRKVALLPRSLQLLLFSVCSATLPRMADSLLALARPIQAAPSSVAAKLARSVELILRGLERSRMCFSPLQWECLKDPLSRCRTAWHSAAATGGAIPPTSTTVAAPPPAPPADAAGHLFVPAEPSALGCHTAGHPCDTGKEIASAREAASVFRPPGLVGRALDQGAEPGGPGPAHSIPGPAGRHLFRAEREVVFAEEAGFTFCLPRAEQDFDGRGGAQGAQAVRLPLGPEDYQQQLPSGERPPAAGQGIEAALGAAPPQEPRPSCVPPQSSSPASGPVLRARSGPPPQGGGVPWGLWEEERGIDGHLVQARGAAAITGGRVRVEVQVAAKEWEAGTCAPEWGASCGAPDEEPALQLRPGTDELIPERRAIATLVWQALQEKLRSSREEERLIQRAKFVEGSPYGVGEEGLIVPLVCPLSLRRMQVPVRGLPCRHRACFDLGAYLEAQATLALGTEDTGRLQVAPWHCPICYREVPWSKILVDGFLLEILEATEESVTSVLVLPDATWQPLPSARAVPGLQAPEAREPQGWRSSEQLPPLGAPPWGGKKRSRLGDAATDERLLRFFPRRESPTGYFPCVRAKMGGVVAAEEGLWPEGRADAEGPGGPPAGPAPHLFYPPFQDRSAAPKLQRERAAGPAAEERAAECQVTALLGAAARRSSVSEGGGGLYASLPLQGQGVNHDAGGTMGAALRSGKMSLAGAAYAPWGLQEQLRVAALERHDRASTSGEGADGADALEAAPLSGGGHAGGLGPSLGLGAGDIPQRNGTPRARRKQMARKG